jgi:hypothetical protein
MNLLLPSRYPPPRHPDQTAPDSDFGVRPSFGSRTSDFGFAARFFWSVFALALHLTATGALAATVRLQDLNLTYITQDWGTPHAGQSVQGNSIRIAGTTYTNGVGTHAVSSAVINLAGAAQHFTANIGVDDEVGPGKGSVEFMVFADNRCVFHSGVMHAGDAAQSVDLDLTGATNLQLVADDTGNGTANDDADWANAVITYSGTAPATVSVDTTANYAPTALYPPRAQRTASPGNTTYYLDPVAGSDANSGLQTNLAWKTFIPVNALLFGPNDRLQILAPGSFLQTLMPMSAASSNAPVIIEFAPGDYDFYHYTALKRKYNISNNNDDPSHVKNIAILFQDTGNFRINGNGATLYVHAKTIFTCFTNAQDIAFSNIHFDYRRPTVSEFTVLSASSSSAVVQVHPDSAYAIYSSKLNWVGTGWTSLGTTMTQTLDPTAPKVWRSGNVLSSVTTATELAPFQLRLSYSSNPGFTVGQTLQFRETYRDCVGGFVLRSQNISWTNSAYYFMHGLGVVGQFSQNLTFDHCNLAPRPGSGRTCSCWGDCLHFSGCRGQITVINTTMAGTQDDPINVHGTHMRIISQPATNQIQVRFMHSQSYGFDAYVPGDEINFVNHNTLVPYATNSVQSIQVVDAYNVILTLASANPSGIGTSDVIENATWTPSVTVSNCQISLSPTRGFLLTTRQKTIVANNNFVKLYMSPILIADDANSWYESGFVRDVTIQNNRFVQCAEPVISISPSVASGTAPVHSGIQVLNNFFNLTGSSAVSASYAQNILITSNRFSTASLPVQTSNCSGVVTTNNQFNASQ